MKFMIPIIALDVSVGVIGVATAFNGDTVASFFLGAGLLVVNFVPLVILGFTGTLAEIIKAETEADFHHH